VRTRFQSLLTRSATILSGFAAALIVLSILLFDQFVVDPLTQRAASDKAALIVLSSQTWLELPPDRRVEFAVALSLYHGLVISDIEESMPPLGSNARYYQRLTSELSDRLDTQVTLYESGDNIWVNVPTNTPRVLQVGFDSQLPHQQQLLVAAAVFIVAGLIVLIGSYAVVRYVARPLDRVSRAAGTFRGATGFRPIPEIGPRELVSLTRNFNQMAKEISQLLENRTTLLAGVSHDLRTPLTRMILELDLAKDGIPEKTLPRLEKNLNVMQTLLDNVMEFAHGTVEQSDWVKLHELIVSILDGFACPISLDWEGDLELEVEIAPTVFERVLTNLVTNSLRYASECRVQVDMNTTTVNVHVLDRGKGIPSHERELVFQPFYRIEKSRSKALGGSGLGLAIVKQLCQLSNWQISLSARQGGGSDIEVQIPLSKTRKETA